MLFSIRQLKLTAIKSFTNLLIQITASSWGLLHFVRNDTLINVQKNTFNYLEFSNRFFKFEILFMKTANSQQPTANSQQPTASVKRCAFPVVQ